MCTNCIHQQQCKYFKKSPLQPIVCPSPPDEMYELRYLQISGYKSMQIPESPEDWHKRLKNYIQQHTQ